MKKPKKMPSPEALEKIVQKQADERAKSINLTGLLPSSGHSSKIKFISDSRGETVVEKLNKSDILPHYETPLKIIRLAFTQDPDQHNNYGSLYQDKLFGLPYAFSKRLSVADSLVASVLQARQSHLAAFGRPRQTRSDVGFTFKIKQEYLREIEKIQDETEKQVIKGAIQDRIEKVSSLLMNCGYTKGWADDDRLTFSQFLAQSVRNALVCGKIATEIITTPDLDNPGQKKFHSFRPLDAGTIYKCNDFDGQDKNAKQIRKQAIRDLARLKNVQIDADKFIGGAYSWVQVINGVPRQAFSSEECVVYDFYKITDVETGGYPITPMDTVLADVLTHINITTHNKLYFQAGRAARGLIVIESDDVDERTLSAVRQQVNASINGVQNSWRLPVFSIGQGDKISWQQIDPTNRDAEFQYLTDMNARVILSAFQMSPDELPGYSHLSKGTNNQSLSETSNEYKLEAHRDVGIRPLITQFEDFLNSCIIPVMDAELSQFAILELTGLDAETVEKEDQRLQIESQLYLTYNDILLRVEKKPIPKEMGGDYPLNPQFQQVLDKCLSMGEQLEYFLGKAGASKDPNWDYVRDSYNVQHKQNLMQQQMMAQQQAMMGGGQMGPPGVQQAIQEEEGGGPGYELDNSQGQGEDLGSTVDQAISSLSEEEVAKSERKLTPENRKILNHHIKTIKYAMDGWNKDVEKATEEIVDVFNKLKMR